MNATLARLRRGYARMWAWCVQKVTRRPRATEGHLDQEAQTNTSLGLMAQAAAAGADMTPEQQIFLSQSEHGMRERLSVLLGIPHRSLAQEREKVAIEAWLARGASSAPQALMAEPPGFLARIMASLIPFFPYILIGGLLLSVTGWGGTLINGWRADRAEHQRDRFREIADNNYRQWEIQHRLAADRLEALTAAQQLSQATADALTAEREARARARGKRAKETA